MTTWSFDAEQRAGRLAVEGGLTIDRVGLVREGLLQGFAQADQLVLDLSRAGEVDVAGLQLLHAAHRYAADKGKVLLLRDGDRFRELAHSVGFARGASGHIGLGAHFWGGDGMNAAL
jgi:ABC-type transporter Mla MlaB component